MNYDHGDDEFSEISFLWELFNCLESFSGFSVFVISFLTSGLSLDKAFGPERLGDGVIQLLYNSLFS